MHGQRKLVITRIGLLDGVSVVRVLEEIDCRLESVNLLRHDVIMPRVGV